MNANPLSLKPHTVPALYRCAHCKHSWYSQAATECSAKTAFTWFKAVQARGCPNCTQRRHIYQAANFSIPDFTQIIE